MTGERPGARGREQPEGVAGDDFFWSDRVACFRRRYLVGSCRVCYISDIVRAGAALKQAMTLARHSDPKMTAGGTPGRG